MVDIVILDSQTWASQKKVSNFLDNFLKSLSGSRTIKLRQKVIFFRMMATMVNAGMTVLKWLSALEKQEKDPAMKLLYSTLIDNLQTWKSLNESLRDYHGNFWDAEVSIIEAWEKTGKLNTSLLQIADQTEKIDGITRKIKGALMYPMVILVAMGWTVMVLMVKVIPTLVAIFEDKSKLPPTTLFLISASEFFQAQWMTIVASFIGGFIFLKIWKKTKSWKYKWDYFMIKVPIFWNMMRKVILSRFARVFSNLLSSGVSVVESIRIVSDAMGNEVYRQRLILLREDVRKGIKMGEWLEEDPLFPDILVQMIKVGEETAKIGETVIKIGDFYDEEVDIAVWALQKSLEPIIIFLLAFVIWGIAVWVMQPMMSMANVVSGG